MFLNFLISELFQVIQLVTLTCSSFLVVISLSFGKPLNDIFGSFSCWLFLSSSHITIANMSYGGLGTAIFRALCAFSSRFTADNVIARKTVQLILKMDLIAEFLTIASIQMGNYFEIARLGDSMLLLTGHWPRVSIRPTGCAIRFRTSNFGCHSIFNWDTGLLNDSNKRFIIILELR